MNNNIQIKANSKDIVAYGLLTHAFGLVISLCALVTFVTLFPKFVGNQNSYATRMREFNVAVGKCLTPSRRFTVGEDPPTCL
jgi:hypothetical protein